MGTFLAVRAAGPGVMTIDRPRAATAEHEVVPGRLALQLASRPDQGQQRIDNVFGQPVRAEPQRALDAIHHLSSLSYLY